MKALVAGAAAIMMGGSFTGCDEAPGEVIEIDGERAYHRTVFMISVTVCKHRTLGLRCS